jgi:hypothetical protein
MSAAPHGELPTASLTRKTRLLLPAEWRSRAEKPRMVAWDPRRFRWLERRGLRVDLESDR